MLPHPQAKRQAAVSRRVQSQQTCNFAVKQATSAPTNGTAFKALEAFCGRIWRLQRGDHCGIIKERTAQQAWTSANSRQCLRKYNCRYCSESVTSASRHLTLSNCELTISTPHLFFSVYVGLKHKNGRDKSLAMPAVCSGNLGNEDRENAAAARASKGQDANKAQIAACQSTACTFGSGNAARPSFADSACNGPKAASLLCTTPLKSFSITSNSPAPFHSNIGESCKDNGCSVSFLASAGQTCFSLCFSDCIPAERCIFATHACIHCCNNPSSACRPLPLETSIRLGSSDISPKSPICSIDQARRRCNGSPRISSVVDSTPCKTPHKKQRQIQVICSATKASCEWPKFIELMHTLGCLLVSFMCK